MRVLHRRCVELPEVHTKPQAAVLFLHHDDQRGLGAVGRTDDAAGQHLLDLGHLLSMNSVVLAAIRLVEGGVPWSLWCAAEVGYSPDCHPLDL